ncbi:hypothetical protein M5F03_10990 [Acinetobacter sp. ANC 5579]|uniref:RipA family octameric membrane protein n=1 Tax=Acinetobacter amyesii TaxID=2942470 RepID=UPI0020C080DE|nr:hypothetical protein [Acinetobacter amyesii]MCL6235677.1 hypothetical protein [Acinetobacter amyesii]
MKKFEFLSNLSSPFFKKGNNLLTIITKLRETNEDKEKEQEERLKKLYYIAVKTRNFEITQLVQRNNFFMIFQGVLIACIIYSNNTVPFIHTAVCFVGVFISFFQMQIAAGAKFWQEYWEIQVYEAEERLRKFYADVKNTTDFHTLFNKDLIEVKNSIYTNFYKDKEKKSKYWKEEIIDGTTIKTFKAPAEFWKKNFIVDFLIKYFPFTRSKTRILTKPSVSKIPVQTGRLLLISWLFLFISSTFIGDWIYNNTISHRIFTGFPGKSVASIDIRNQNLPPNRDDGYDDNRYKEEDSAYCIFKWCKENIEK